jgi:5-methylcytosine-specific restriction endonuclease McrA
VNKVLDAKEGYKYCSQCKKELPKDDRFFFNGGKSAGGFTSACKACKTDYGYGYAKPNKYRDEKRECLSCGEVFDNPSENFYTKDGDRLESECKSCSTERKNQSRRAKNADVEEDISTEQWLEIVESYNSCCAYCGESDTRLQRDHIIPISRGGPTTPENLVPACPRCNLSKSDKTVSEWYPKQDFHTAEREARIINIPYDRLRC